MKFKVDENLPVEAAAILRSKGHDATTVREQNLSGSSDRRLASVLRDEERIVITLDTDFADIRSYPPEDFVGLIVLRLRRQDRDHVVTTLKRLLPILSEEPLSGHLWIVEENALRIR